MDYLIFIHNGFLCFKTSLIMGVTLNLISYFYKDLVKEKMLNISYLLYTVSLLSLYITLIYILFKIILW